MDSDTEEVVFYKHVKKDFPKNQNLILLVHREDQQSFDLNDFKVLHGELKKVLTRSSVIEGILSPFVIRLVDFSEDANTLNFPKIFSQQISEEQVRKFSESYWKQFFVGKNNNSLLLSIDFSRELKSNESREFIDELNFPAQYKVSITGELAYKNFAEDGFLKMNKLTLLALIILLVLMSLFFWSYQVLIYSSLSILLGIIPIFGLMGIWTPQIDLLTSNLFLLLLIAGLEDLFLICFFSFRKNISIRESLKLILIPCFYTSLTTFIGFGSLMISEVPAVRTFGMWAAAGTMLEYFVAFFVIPQLLKGMTGIKLNAIRLKSINLPEMNGWLSKIVFLILIIPVFISPFLVKHLNYHATPFDLFPDEHPIMKIKNEVKETRGWEHFIEVYFPGNQSSQDVDRKIADFKKVKNISWIESPRTFINQKLPLDLYSLTLDSLALSKEGKKYFSGQSERVFLYVEDSDTESIAMLTREIKNICRDLCRPTGELIAFGEYSRLLVETLSESLLVSLFLILIVIVLLCFYLEIKNIWQVSLSIVWGPLLVLSILILTATPVTLVNCILLSMIAGISGDNAIQYIFNKKNFSLTESVDEIGPGSILLTTFLILLCLPFLFSDFKNVQLAGYLLMAGLLLMCFGDYFILKGLMTFRKRTD